MKEIPLTRGQIALVDDEDYERVMERGKWYVVRGINISLARGRDMFYAMRTVVVAGKKRAESMHRFVMGLFYGDKRVVDHINGETLDNRHSNLRITNVAENGANGFGPRRGSRYGIRGVYYDTYKNLWKAQIKIQGTTKHIGYFHDIRKAAEAYTQARLASCGIYHPQNFNDMPYDIENPDQLAAWRKSKETK